MMIANFNQSTGVAAWKTEVWNIRTQYREAPIGSFIERVCYFLEQYPLLTVEGEDGASSTPLPLNPG